MKITVENVSVIKPSILRVHAYIHGKDYVQDFELAIAVQDFVDFSNPKDVLIDLDKFRNIITKFIADSFDTANLASALNSTELVWDVTTINTPVENEQETIPKSVEGSKLAFGDNNDNT